MPPNEGTQAYNSGSWLRKLTINRVRLQHANGVYRNPNRTTATTSRRTGSTSLLA